MPSGSRRAVTRVFSLAMIVIGIALIVRTIVSGVGGGLGIVIGVLFVVAGAGRLYLVSRG